MSDSNRGALGCEHQDVNTLVQKQWLSLGELASLHPQPFNVVYMYNCEK